MSRAALAVFCMLAFGCTESSTSQSGNRQEVRSVATEAVKLRMQKKPDAIKEVIAPRQKEDIDFSTLDGEVSAAKEALLPHASVSADTSVLQGDYGYVLVTVEMPEMEGLMEAAGMGLSDRLSLARTVENGEPAVVKSRLEDLIEKAKGSSGSVPTSKERKNIPVLKSDDGEWKAVLRAQLADRIKDGRDAVEPHEYDDRGEEGNWEKAESTLQYAMDLAPSLDLTHDFASEVVRERVERASTLLRRNDLQKAEETLKRVEKRCSGMEETEDLSNQIAQKRKEFVRADSVEMRISSAEAVKNDSRRGIYVQAEADVEIQYAGSDEVEAIYSDLEADLNLQNGPLSDTTISRRIRLAPDYSSVDKTLANEMDVGKYGSARISASDIEITPRRVELE